MNVPKDLTSWSSRDLNLLSEAVDSVANGGSRAFVGSADPSSTLSVGAEYAWFQTDGAGTLIDIIVGVA